MKHTVAALAVIPLAIGLGGCARSQLAPVIDLEPAAIAVSAVPPSEPELGASSDIVVHAVTDEYPQGVALSAPEVGTPAQKLTKTTTPASPAIVALLNSASAHSSAGQHDAASASLERALQIEPHNAWVWHRLARTRLDQGQLEQAASLAARSNTFAADDRPLLADNWRLIAATRQRLGDASGARAATLRADGFVSTMN